MAYDSLAASQQTADRSEAVETWLIYACIASGITVSILTIHDLLIIDIIVCKH